MKKSKPWMPFYPSDWRSDPKLRMCSLAARGLWIEMMALMHEASPYGHLLVSGSPPNDAQLAVLTGTSADQIPDLLGELESQKVFSRTGKGVIYSRRMTRDEKRSRIATKNGKRGGNPKLRKQTGKSGADNQKSKGADKPQRPETRGQSLPPTPYGVGEAVGDWNALAADLGLSECQKVTEARRRAIAARLKEDGEEGWRRALSAIRARSFYRGENDRGWRANIDYVARLNAFTKLLEEAPAAAPGGAGIEPPQTAREWERRVKFFAEHGRWHAPGPKPDEPGCQAPPEVLQAHGYGREDA